MLVKFQDLPAREPGSWKYLFRQREFDLKNNRSRFKNLEALKEWKSPGFGGQLSYRWRITASYLSDLADARESGK